MKNKEISLNVLQDANVLIDSFSKTKKTSTWKQSVQKYEINLLRNVNKTVNSLKNGTYEQLPYNEFLLSDRGKKRYIKAVPIKDRVVLRALCDHVLLPQIENHLIYDSGASLPGKGINFTRNRLKTHLHKYYRKFGSEGYVLLIDFSKFFDNIRHDKLMELFSEIIDDKDTLDFISKFIDSFKIDVSNMTDEEYKECLNILYDSVEYSYIDKKLHTGEKFMNKSLSVGSQISQISGLLYTSKIDNYCKIVRSCKYYGRYMDDAYAISDSKDYLYSLLDGIEDICKEYGIFINSNKTKIIKLSKGFPFLKRNYTLTNTGKVVETVNKQSLVRIKRKLKSFRKFLDEDLMTMNDIDCSYYSTIGSLEDANSYESVRSVKKLYQDLFKN